MNKKEIVEKLQVPGQYMEDYLDSLEGLKRSELVELANDVDASIRSDYSNLDIKKAIVNVFMLTRHWAAVRQMTTTRFNFGVETIDDIETAIERREE